MEWNVCSTHWKNSSDGILAFLAVSEMFFHTSMVTSFWKTHSCWLVMIPPSSVQFFESNLRQASVFQGLSQEAHGKLEVNDEKM